MDVVIVPCNGNLLWLLITADSHDSEKHPASARVSVPVIVTTGCELTKELLCFTKDRFFALTLVKAN